MTPSRVLSVLESLAARVGIAVRAEAFGRGLLQGRGGLCWVRGEPLVVMDEALAIPDRIAVLAAALGHFDLDGVYVAPAIRELIDRAREDPGELSRIARGPSGNSTMRPRAKPGLARGRPPKGGDGQ